MGPEGFKVSEDFEKMDWGQLESHPVAGPVLQEQALKFLQQEDADWFSCEFNGERDADGYLMKKDGTSSNTLPSQNVGGEGLLKVAEMTKAELRR